MEVHTKQIPHARRDLRPWQAQVQALPPRLVLAATGEDEPAVAAALPGLPVVVINPRQTPDFARAGGPG